MFPQAVLDCLEKYIKGCKIVLGQASHIKEAQWENVLCQACVAANVPCEWNYGSHKPGGDVVIENIGYSCKTSKLSRTTMSISSYRLTKVCKTGDKESFINEIDNIRKDFKYYAILARDHTGNKYTVYVIPGSYFLAGKLEWKKDENDNWKGTGCNYTMKIVKSMSCQLWIDVPLTDIEEFIVLETSVENLKYISYGELFEMLHLREPEVEAPAPAASASASSGVAEDGDDELSKQLANLVLVSST